MLDSYSILLQVFKSKSDTAGVFNWGGWSYPEIDKLITAASTEMDRDKRLAMQSEALKLVKDNLIMIPFTSSRWRGPRLTRWFRWFSNPTTRRATG